MLENHQRVACTQRRPDRGTRLDIRSATIKDAESLLDIYAHYVENTAITFEYEVPSCSEFEDRIINTLRRYPYLVLEDDDEIWGYAYAGPFITRPAADRSCEVTIYLDRDARGRGYGRALYTVLEDRLREMGITNLYALVADPLYDDDDFLSRNSEQFHAHLGFSVVGKAHQCGFKFGHWYNLLWMEKIIGDHV